MDQDNTTRLKEKFRFAEAGARCRTASFINPSLASLGQSEWMEAECSTGQGWDIKIMKLYPSSVENQSAEIEQTYLEAQRNLSFGAMVLKLTEYQKAQAALGFPEDPQDSGQITGARPYRDLAEEAGIAFDVSGEPVAPVQGLITIAGRYPADAFMKAQKAVSMYAATALTITDQTVSGSTALSVPAAEFPMEEILKYKKIVGLLTTLAEKVKSDGGRNILDKEHTDYVIFYYSSPKYNAIEYKLDAVFAEIGKLVKSPDGMPDFLKERLNLFEFQTFRIMSSSIISLFENNGSHANDKKSNAALKSSMQRCEAAWKKINPGQEMMKDKVFTSRVDPSALTEIIDVIRLSVEGGAQKKNPSLPSSPPPRPKPK